MIFAKSAAMLFHSR